MWLALKSTKEGFGLFSHAPGWFAGEGQVLAKSSHPPPIYPLLQPHLIGPRSTSFLRLGWGYSGWACWTAPLRRKCAEPQSCGQRHAQSVSRAKTP